MGILENKNIFKAGFFLVINALFFLNLITYTGILHLTPFPAYLIDLGLFLLLFAFYLKKRLEPPVGNKIFLWLIYYLSLNFLYFILSDAGPGEFGYLKVTIFFSFFIFYTVLFFNLDDEELTLTKKTMVILGMIATVMLVTDYLDQGIFYRDFLSDTSKYFVPGRAAATYMDANIAGGAMVLFLIFTIDVIPKAWRIPYILVLFLGLFATMSRSNIMIFMLTLVIMFFQRKIYGRHLLALMASVVMFFTWLASGGLEYLGDTFEFKVTENMLSRVNFFADREKSDTSDMQERKEVLAAALNMFADSPFAGQGFAAVRLWDHRVSPHNTFAMHWAEFGIFGILILPLLFYFSSVDIFRYGTATQKHTAILVILFFTLSSFFSHNMLDQQLDVAAIVALSVMGYKSRKKHFSEKKGLH